ncbi:unnamed protein product [Vitrella brassicaformis CCMP3155]|uniref:Uncharacterized protein n=3 Tax=Vitrella brassicaformis TaxID=1169539 RepID=A0A0G4EQV1_VITBC|nr:unnamed protein product [Vitrella brassicaformis CCMP3155]|eukprot:CEL99820.1 unnamed protein product [Vitrella brassicaformis CCMP3155]
MEGGQAFPHPLAVAPPFTYQAHPDAFADKGCSRIESLRWFYKTITKGRPGQRPAVWIPDTVFYDGRKQPTLWVFTNKRGLPSRHRSRRLTHRNILRHFCSFRFLSTIIPIHKDAWVALAHYKHRGQLACRLLTLAELTFMLPNGVPTEAFNILSLQQLPPAASLALQQIGRERSSIAAALDYTVFGSPAVEGGVQETKDPLYVEIGGRVVLIKPHATFMRLPSVYRVIVGGHPSPPNTTEVESVIVAKVLRWTRRVPSEPTVSPPVAAQEDYQGEYVTTTQPTDTKPDIDPYGGLYLPPFGLSSLARRENAATALLRKRTADGLCSRPISATGGGGGGGRDASGSAFACLMDDAQAKSPSAAKGGKGKGKDEEPCSWFVSCREPLVKGHLETITKRLVCHLSRIGGVRVDGMHLDFIKTDDSEVFLLVNVSGFDITSKGGQLGSDRDSESYASSVSDDDGEKATGRRGRRAQGGRRRDRKGEAAEGKTWLVADGRVCLCEGDFCSMEATLTLGRALLRDNDTIVERWQKIAVSGDRAEVRIEPGGDPHAPHRISPGTVIISRMERGVPLEIGRTKRMLTQQYVNVCNRCFMAYAKIDRDRRRGEGGSPEAGVHLPHRGRMMTTSDIRHLLDEQLFQQRRSRTSVDSHLAAAAAAAATAAGEQDDHPSSASSDRDRPLAFVQPQAPPARRRQTTFEQAPIGTLRAAVWVDRTPPQDTHTHTDRDRDSTDTNDAVDEDDGSSSSQLERMYEQLLAWERECERETDAKYERDTQHESSSIDETAAEAAARRVLSRDSTETTLTPPVHRASAPAVVEPPCVSSRRFLPSLDAKARQVARRAKDTVERLQRTVAHDNPSSFPPSSPLWRRVDGVLLDTLLSQAVDAYPSPVPIMVPSLSINTTTHIGAPSDMVHPPMLRSPSVGSLDGRWSYHRYGRRIARCHPMRLLCEVWQMKYNLVRAVEDEIRRSPLYEQQRAACPATATAAAAAAAVFVPSVSMINETSPVYRTLCTIAQAIIERTNETPEADGIEGPLTRLLECVNQEAFQPSAPPSLSRPLTAHRDSTLEGSQTHGHSKEEGVDIRLRRKLFSTDPKSTKPRQRPISAPPPPGASHKHPTRTGPISSAFDRLFPPLYSERVVAMVDSILRGMPASRELAGQLRAVREREGVLSRIKGDVWTVPGRQSGGGLTLEARRFIGRHHAVVVG